VLLLIVHRLGDAPGPGLVGCPSPAGAPRVPGQGAPYVTIMIIGQLVCVEAQRVP